jgi:hypothetical protein
MDIQRDIQLTSLSTFISGNVIGAGPSSSSASELLYSERDLHHDTLGTSHYTDPVHLSLNLYRPVKPSCIV